jgi:murein L,D-transpeptidase YcbB/YkuD
VKNELMPAIKKDKSYLKKKNMEIVSTGKDSIPTVRQLPGKDNALGTMKFLFPNSFDIYLHDTPDKSLFKKNNRAISHGCIRVADAPKLAAYLLEDQKDWNEEKIKSTAGTGKEQTVNLQKKVPVMITYYTAWVDETGQLRFANDVYDHDKSTMARMFTGKQNMNIAKTGNTDSSKTKKDSLARP